MDVALHPALSVTVLVVLNKGCTDSAFPGQYRFFSLRSDLPVWILTESDFFISKEYNTKQ